MIKLDILDFIRVKGEISVPELQQKFDLRYGEARKVIAEMEERGELVLQEGITYKYVPPVVKETPETSTINQKRDELSRLLNQTTDDGVPLFNIKALAFMIKENTTDMHRIKTRFAAGLYTVFKAVRWCEEQGFVSPRPENKLLITKDEFVKRFGNYDEWGFVDTDQQSPKQKSETILEYFPPKPIDDDDEEDDDDIFDFDLSDDDDDDDDD